MDLGQKVVLRKDDNPNGLKAGQRGIVLAHSEYNSTVEVQVDVFPWRVWLTPDYLLELASFEEV